MKGDVAAVKECLAVKGINVNKLVKKYEHYSRPALVALSGSDCEADEKTQCEMARLLIDAGASPDLPNRDGSTALHYARRSAALMKILLSATPASNINAKDVQSSTPLHTQQCQLLGTQR